MAGQKNYIIWHDKKIKENKYNFDRAMNKQ